MTGRDSSWRDRASCTGRLDLPWIADAAQARRSPAAEMGAVCASCPVRAVCAEVAETTRATAGFWAGRWRGAGGEWLLTPDERHAASLAGARKAAATRQAATRTADVTGRRAA